MNTRSLPIINTTYALEEIEPTYSAQVEEVPAIIDEVLSVTEDNRRVNDVRELYAALSAALRFATWDVDFKEWQAIDHLRNKIRQLYKGLSLELRLQTGVQVCTCGQVKQSVCYPIE